MNIAVVGLGLIGGSLCKSIKKNTHHKIFGIDNDKNVIKKALESGAIDKEIAPKQLNQSDLTIICLYADQTIEFINQQINNFSKESIVCDACGLKLEIIQKVDGLLFNAGINFVGFHPMAGKELSGFNNSTENLFYEANAILTKTKLTKDYAIHEIKKLLKLIGFTNIVITDAKTHDEIITFTSQLAHIVSSAYIMSPTSKFSEGFTGGSFQDLTRVSYMNSNMWSELFLKNKANLLYELNNIINNLTDYKKAIEQEDQDALSN
ncbi:MAG: prephenate dehydrogenase, partial [Oscillospiraceae bacterium]|nr:prephenate dehydrogenase [Oscillospiraceae bacterium]